MYNSAYVIVGTKAGKMCVAFSSEDAAWDSNRPLLLNPFKGVLEKTSCQRVTLLPMSQQD